LTNHVHVLLCIVRDPSMRLRDVASVVGITERAAQSIVADLVTDGYLLRVRQGRRNHYEFVPDHPLRPHDNRSLTIGGLVDFLQTQPRTVEYATSVFAMGGARSGSGNGNGNGHANGNGHSNGNGHHDSSS
jgi:hypothetical protein